MLMSFCVKKLLRYVNPLPNIRQLLPEQGFALLLRLFDYNPETRITAAEALNHEFFREMPCPTEKYAKQFKMIYCYVSQSINFAMLI
jgi:serine/threonine protein kinase